MANQEKINKQVEDALHSLDGIQQAAGKPFLLTRIKVKMQPSQTPSVWDTVLAFISKPLVAVTCIALIIAINVWVLSDTNRIHTNTEDSYAIADEYNTNTVTINEFENLEP